jgi:hypothetical protein
MLSGLHFLSVTHVHCSSLEMPMHLLLPLNVLGQSQLGTAEGLRIRSMYVEFGD